MNVFQKVAQILPALIYIFWERSKAPSEVQLSECCLQLSVSCTKNSSDSSSQRLRVQDFIGRKNILIHFCVRQYWKKKADTLELC
jgi:hypothetical protein